MLEHLISLDLDPLVCPADAEDFVGLDAASPAAVLSGQIATATWLEELGFTPKTEAEVQSAGAHAVFRTLTTSANEDEQRTALTTLKVPDEIRRITGMLTAYDWEFVAEAQRLRSFVVARLVEETEGEKASTRLKALELLGKVTEVGLFTEKVEVKKIDATDDEINTRIREKIGAFLKIQDAVATRLEPAIDVEPKRAE